jgi:NADPH:quinone reductase-like Zn-dependent oxidoreductase
MRAVIIRGYGGPDALELADVPVPQPSTGQVRIRVHAAPLRGTRVHNVWIHTDGPRLAELAALVDAGRLTPRVARTLPLEQVATAHQRVADGGLRGRIVLTLNA